MSKIKQKQYQSCCISHDLSTLSVITTTYNIEGRKYSLISETEKDYPLKKTTEEEILKLRLQKEMGFVLKIMNTLYYTQIPENFNLFSSNIFETEHRCKTCQHFFQKKSCCPKTYDLNVKEADLFFPSNPEIAVKNSQRIEKYDFITLGCETFYNFSEVFIVGSCNKYKKQ